MKKRKPITLPLALSVLMLAACSAPATAAQETAEPLPSATPEQAAAAASPEPFESDANASVDEEGITALEAQALDSALPPLPSGALRAAEIADLMYMREEEKLAGDVYMALYELWGLNIFQNISNAEQAHTEAVKSLLERYDLQDPALGNAPGVFTNSDLQDLYDRLVEEGSRSLADALRVGGAIEELDILDLEAALSRTDQPDIRLVYENLMKGSRNHLRAFASTYERRAAGTYQPQYLDQVDFQEIVSTGVEKGGGRGP